MNITQNYSGGASHKPHTTGTPKDYPFDEACGDTGRSPMHCPCDEMKVVRVYTKGTNTLWLESTTKCNLADGTSDIVTIMVTHPNDSDFKNLTVGKKFKRGEIICYEGTDGNATGNHFHFSAGKGKIKGNGWAENSNKKWVLTTTNGTYKPETLFFIDKAFTTVKKSNGIELKEKPKEIDFFAGKPCFKKGDMHKNIGLIASFMRKTFPAYTSALALGNYYGVFLEKSIKEFQRRTGLVPDGAVGPITLEMLEKNGFKK